MNSVFEVFIVAVVGGLALAFFLTKLTINTHKDNAYRSIMHKIKLCYGNNAIQMLRIICRILKKNLEKDGQDISIVTAQLNAIDSINIFNGITWDKIIDRTDELCALSLEILGVDNPAHLMILNIITRIKDCEKRFDSVTKIIQRASEKPDTLFSYLIDSFSGDYQPPYPIANLQKQIDETLDKIFPPTPTPETDREGAGALLGLS